MRLVLFDIDGTLLNSGGMGRAAMQRALGLVFGSPGNPSYRYDGKTDKQIVRDVMRLGGHTDEHIDARMEKLIELYLDGLREGAKSGKFNVRPLEGVVPLLDAPDEPKDVLLGLLTGNVKTHRQVLRRFSKRNVENKDGVDNLADPRELIKKARRLNSI